MKTFKPLLLSLAFAAAAPFAISAHAQAMDHSKMGGMNMPGMTMVFQVKDAALLDKVKAGDKVTFTAEKADGAIVVTAIEAVK